MNPITKILSKKFPVEIAKVTSKENFYCLHIPLNPNLYRDKDKNLILTGNQLVVVANAVGGSYGYVETFAKVRAYRSKRFNETTVNKTVVTGQNMLEVATKLVE